MLERVLVLRLMLLLFKCVGLSEVLIVVVIWLFFVLIEWVRVFLNCMCLV